MGDSEHHLWIFRIVGGEPFTAQVPGNPAVIHNGRMTLCQQMLTDEQAVEVQQVALDHGCSLKDARKAPGQTEAQRAERLRTMGRGREDEVWPSGQCPNCFWFDVEAVDDPCGYRSWPRETVVQAMKTNPRAASQLVLCPLHGDGEDDGSETQART